MKKREEDRTPVKDNTFVLHSGRHFSMMVVHNSLAAHITPSVQSSGVRDVPGYAGYRRATMSNSSGPDKTTTRQQDAYHAT
ncbi:hypothetical protein F2P81_001722 [Scophthalmus maximus]|uniref:Uncharacterized protein n=1 Tax=Scophthalmus maximus TaxID=52904 RepID=A0A6A4TGY3_SCOMX|nr:hypothetical protein F2P81_001722 [Scophthalmus maximus]